VIVFCEECGEKNNIEPGKTEKAPGYIRCQVCNEIIEIAMPEAFQARLELRFYDQVIEMNHGRPVVTMGRIDQNDLIVEDKHVSRTHAVIVNRGNDFVLTDLSMNGTFIHTNGKKSIALIRDDFVLSGNGMIGLGRKVASDSPEAISFTVLE
jgi:adenylate cyclase